MGLRHILNIILITLSVHSSGQDSTSVTIVIRDQQSGDNINRANLLVVDTVSNKVIHSFTTDTTGLIKFKVPKRDSGKVVKLDLSRCHYLRYDHEFELGRWKEQYQEYYMMPIRYCGISTNVFLYKKNEYDSILDTYYSDVFNHVNDILKVNPTTIITLVGRYNFDEERKIGKKRLQHIKSFFKGKDYNMERLNFNVMEPDYVKWEIDYKCDTIYYDQEKFEKADPKTLRKFESIYQQVYIRIDSWDYIPKND